MVEITVRAQASLLLLLLLLLSVSDIHRVCVLPVAADTQPQIYRSQCANTLPETLVFKQPKIVADTGDGNGRGNKDMPGGEQLMCAKGGHTSDEPMALRFWRVLHARDISISSLVSHTAH